MRPYPRTIQLWRRCLRCCRIMDGPMGNYYHGFVRQHIVAHKGEDDPGRLEHLLERGEQNLRFVLRKYHLEEPRRPEIKTFSGRPSSRRAGTMRRGRGESEEGNRKEDIESVWTPGQR